MKNEYIEKFLEVKKDLKNRDKKKKKIKTEKEYIINTLDVMNAWTLAISPETDFSEDADALIEFLNYFMDNYGENEELLEAMEDNWGDYPRILRMGLYFQEEKDLKEFSNYYNKMTEKQKKNIETLSNYVLKERKVSYVTFCYNDESYQLFIDKTEPRKSLEFKTTCLKGALAKAIKNNGSVVFRIIDSKKVSDTVCGFYMKNGIITIIPEEPLKIVLNTNPDGSVEDLNSDKDTYIKPKLYFLY